MKLMKLILAIGAMAALAATAPEYVASSLSAQASQTVDPSLYSGMRWRSVGPARGGRSIAVAGSETRPLEYWFGATGGGAWKTTDGGSNWAPMTDGKINTSSIGSLAVCQSNPDVVYIGGGETQLPRQHHPGRRRLQDQRRRREVGSPQRPARLAGDRAAARPSHQLRHRLRGRARPGLQRRTRSAASSSPPTAARRGGARCSATTRPAASTCRSIRRIPNVIFASLWEAHRTPWCMSSGGPGSGLFKSTDGGDTWTEITKNPGLPTGLWGKVGVSVSGADSNRVYAIIENETAAACIVSDDAGATWKMINDDRNLRQRAFYYTHIIADPVDKDTVYVLNVQFFKSTDGGKTTDQHPRAARRQPRPVDFVHRQQADGAGQRRRRATSSVNGGQTWTGQDIPTGQFYNVFTTRHVPYHICGAQQDNSTACVGSQTNPGAGEGSLPPIFYAVGGGESGYIAPDPRDPNVFFAGSYGGYLSRLDRETGQQRAVNIYPNNPMG